MSGKPILVVGLTPTVQRTLFFEGFALGEVNRAKETVVTASGKGANVARVVTLLGGAATVVQFLGGDSGRFLERTLGADGVKQHNIWLHDAPTRTCATLLLGGDGPTTELVEEAQPVAEKDVEAAEGAVRALLQGGEWGALCCSGSLPPGVPPPFFSRLAGAAKAAGVPVLVDAQKAPLRAALEEKPFLVKPNLEEAAATLALTRTGDTEADAQTAVSALLEAGAEWALVSLGAAGSLLGGRSGERARIFGPQVAAVNPIGSGDSLAAGTLHAHFQRGLSLPEAVGFGTACAAANCLSPTSGVVARADVERLWPLVRREAH